VAGVYPKRQICDEKSGHQKILIVRPLLNERRAELRQYLESVKQPWREDTTNIDPCFTRNRIRHELLPLIERHYSPGIATLLSGMAEIARNEQDYWDIRSAALFAQCGGHIVARSDHELRCRLDFCNFSKLALAEQRRLVAFVLGSFAPDLHHIEAARAAILRGKTTSLPGGLDLSVSPDGELLVRRRVGP
jgi:tRNA(Ile)-lysidine synthase